MSVTPNADSVSPNAGGAMSSGDGEPYPWVEVDLSAATFIDNNNVIASGSMASGSFTSAAVASDTRSTGGDPARLVTTIYEDLTGIQGIFIELRGVDFTKTASTGIVVQVVDDDDPSVGKGASFHWLAYNASSWRCSARAPFQSVSIPTNQSITTPTRMRGYANFIIHSDGSLRICNPWAVLTSSDKRVGNANRASSSTSQTLSGTGSFKLVLALQQLAAARDYVFTGLRYRLVPAPS